MTIIVKNVSFILSPVELHPAYSGATHTTPPTTGNSTRVPSQQVSNETLENDERMLTFRQDKAVIPLE